MLFVRRIRQNSSDISLFFRLVAVCMLAALPDGCHCIIGGDESNFAKDYPFIVRTRAYVTFTRRSATCTGILIAADKALVPGQCTRIRNHDATRMTVRPAGESSFEVYQFVRTALQGLHHMRELAMLRINRQRSSAIVTINLSGSLRPGTRNAFISSDPSQGPSETRDHALVAGYGRYQPLSLQQYAKRAKKSTVRQFKGHVASFSLISEYDCKDESYLMLNTTDFDYSVVLCVRARHDRLLPALCEGDLGAPIFVEGPSGIQILAIVSYRWHSYCRTRHPTFGMRLEKHLDWIKRWMSTPTPWPNHKMFVFTLKSGTEASLAKG